MIKCSVCGDEGWLPELEPTDDGFECGSPGCGLAWGEGEFMADELSFGFHIIEAPEDEL